MRPGSLVDKAVFDQGPDRLEAVPPVQFFAGLARARMIRDGHFHDAVSGFPDLGRYLGTKFKAGTIQRDRVQHFPAESLVAGRFVRDAGAVQNISQYVQQLDAEKMMEALDLVFGPE